MSGLAAASLVIGFLVIVGVPILWLIFRSGVDPAANIAATREFERKLLNPNFAALEAAIGAPLPLAVLPLYRSRELLLGYGWRFSVANDGQTSSDSTIAFFQPAEVASLRDLGDGDTCWFAFANDGTGDEYLVDLKLPDPEVIYLQHETGKQFRLGVTLAQFLAQPRQPVDDD
jgi:hypothetical protein